MHCSTCVNPRLKKRCLGREEGFIEDDPEPARNEEDENSPEKLLEEVERDLNTVVFPRENTVMLPQEYAARAAHIAQLQRSLTIRNAETAARSMPPPVKLRHDMRPAFVNNEEEPPRHDPMPQNVDIDDEEEEEEEEEPAPKRKRGRPPGSKSKPKLDTASQPQHSQPPPPINAPVNNQPVNDRLVVTTPPSHVPRVSQTRTVPSSDPVASTRESRGWKQTPTTSSP